MSNAIETAKSETFLSRENTANPMCTREYFIGIPGTRYGQWTNDARKATRMTLDLALDLAREHNRRAGNTLYHAPIDASSADGRDDCFYMGWTVRERSPGFFIARKGSDRCEAYSLTDLLSRIRAKEGV